MRDHRAGGHPGTMTTTHLERSELTRAATTTAATPAAIAALLLALAAWLVHDTATYVAAPHEDTSLHGLGYVVAAFVAVPAVLSAVLAGTALLVTRRHRAGWGPGLAIAALVVMLPVVLLASASAGLG